MIGYLLVSAPESILLRTLRACEAVMSCDAEIKNDSNDLNLRRLRVVALSSRHLDGARQMNLYNYQQLRVRVEYV